MLFDDLSYMFSKKYPVSDIYVGELGYVTKDGNHIKINGTEDFIIFRKVKFDNFDYMGKDFFTNKNYFFWDGNKYPGDTIWRAIDGYAIFFSVPIEQFLSSPKKYISKKELFIYIIKKTVYLSLKSCFHTIHFLKCIYIQKKNTTPNVI